MTTEATRSGTNPDTAERFSEQDIERSRSLVGVYHATTQREHFTVASEDVIHNFARGYGDDNPLYTDAGYGATTRWGSLIAPPMIGIAVNKQLMADPIPKDQRRPAFRGIHAFVSGSNTTFYAPVYPGDALYQFQGFENVEVKESEFAGRSVIITRAHVRMNQRGQVVSVSRVIVIHTERHEAKGRNKYADIEPARYTEDDIAAIDAIYEAETRRGPQKRYWEDVNVGETTGTTAKGPLTITDMLVFHAGGYGFTPYAPSASRLGYLNRKRIKAFYVPNEYGVPDVAQRVHWDNDWAKSVGVPMAYDYGMLRDCWLTHHLTNWMGDDGWLVQHSSQMRKFNYVGDTHLITGEVTGKRVEDGQHLVDITLRGASQRGEVTCPAEATVALPSRESGAIELPSVPTDVSQAAVSILSRHGELLKASPTLIR
ncbi:FAS1-like dehydratase domain-containing protein [[Mycobacterium] vasticus]|uniref:MaoC family dehydratase N-terminal domain-containing protein n=1 Tax=[Mycobacterium] vasticus TaxID=2875777 RepID=A0ABU5Z430_9MYCO|nr:MaoC family dehydratase N-terminal domain-containing protein [Mycolicibacter sp. MYC017]MEB3070723.1 MaoC family dehydratase N-terminal domain-containing protein [Mycolicibacter sp. MYC017]